jgi:hypothetical protein
LYIIGFAERTALLELGDYPWDWPIRRIEGRLRALSIDNVYSGLTSEVLATLGLKRGHSRKTLLLELFKEIRKNRRLQKLAAEYEDL